MLKNISIEEDEGLILKYNNIFKGRKPSKQIEFIAVQTNNISLETDERIIEIYLIIDIKNSKNNLSFNLGNGKLLFIETIDFENDYLNSSIQSETKCDLNNVEKDLSKIIKNEIIKLKSEKEKLLSL